jgi:molybdate transport system substrate-binding protein
VRISTVLSLGALFLCGCNRLEIPAAKPEITVAAAANLMDVFGEIGRTFEGDSGIRVVYSYGATSSLALQIENGGPFDVFAAADTVHIQRLTDKGLLIPATKAVYARGQLSLWVPPNGKAHLRSLADLTNPAVRYIAIAKPEAAPYGKAAVESLQALKLWPRIQTKVVYAENIQIAKQYAESGNADAAFTAYSLVLRSGGNSILVDEKLHAPIDQALAVVQHSGKQDAAQKFARFVLGPKGREILARYGYLLPVAR